MIMMGVSSAGIAVPIVEFPAEDDDGNNGGRVRS
jgi:hypothetical protein